MYLAASLNLPGGNGTVFPAHHFLHSSRVRFPVDRRPCFQEQDSPPSPKVGLIWNRSDLFCTAAHSSIVNRSCQLHARTPSSATELRPAETPLLPPRGQAVAYSSAVLAPMRPRHAKRRRSNDGEKAGGKRQPSQRQLPSRCSPSDIIGSAIWYRNRYPPH